MTLLEYARTFRYVHLEPSLVSHPRRRYLRRKQLRTTHAVPVCGMRNVRERGDRITHDPNATDCELCLIWWRAHTRDCLNRIRTALPA